MQLYFFVIFGTVSLFALLYFVVAVWLAHNHPQREDQLFNTLLELMKRNTIRMPDFLGLLGWFRRQNPEVKTDLDPRLPAELPALPISGSNLPRGGGGTVENPPNAFVSH